MKNFTMRLTFAVATLAAAALSASAQTYKADVPMAFSAGGKRMPAGTYDFVVRTGATAHSVVTVRNEASSQAAVIMALPGSDAPKAWRQAGKPLVSFECAGHSCNLRKLWDARSLPMFEFPAHKLPAVEAERVSIVIVGLVKSE